MAELGGVWTRVFRSIPLGSIAGIPLRIHISLLILLVCQTLFYLFYGWVYALLMFCLFGPVLLGTLVVHELGHALAARAVGGDCKLVLLWPLGARAYIGHNAGPKADMLVAIAGPLMHLPMVCIWFTLLGLATFANTGRLCISLKPSYIDSFSSFLVALCLSSILLNVSLLVFNTFVPAYPLDGGRFLIGFLLTCGMEENLVAIIAVVLSVLAGGAILFLGFRFFDLVTILVALYILQAAYALFDAVQKGMIKQHPLFAYEPMEEPPDYTPLTLDEYDPVAEGVPTQPPKGYHITSLLKDAWDGVKAFLLRIERKLTSVTAPEPTSASQSTLIDL